MLCFVSVLFCLLRTGKCNALICRYLIVVQIVDVPGVDVGQQTGNNRGMKKAPTITV